MDYLFVRLPTWILYGEKAGKLSDGARLLYADILRRFSLSRKNKWYDEDGRYFIYYTVSDVSRLLRCGKGKAVKVLSELDVQKGIGLIEKKRVGLGNPDIIFLVTNEEDMNLTKNEIDEDMSLTENDEDNSLTENENVDNMLISGTNNGIHKVSYSDPERFKNENSGGTKTGLPDFRKSESNYNNINKKELNKNNINNITHSFINERDDVNEFFKQKNFYESVIKSNIGFGERILKIPPSRLDEIIRIMVGAMCSKELYVKMGSITVPREELRERFLNIEREHIENVYADYCKVNVPIKNIHNYILTSLYRAFDTASLKLDNNESLVE